MSFFRKAKRTNTEPGSLGPLTACPACGRQTFTAVTRAFDAKGGFEPAGELVDERTGHCECGLLAWGEVYAPSADAETRERLALINNTLLLNWTRECRARHSAHEPTTEAHQRTFYSEARRRLGPDFPRLNHQQFVALCLRGAEQRLRARR